MQKTSLGAYLRQGREEAGLTLEALAERTRIPRVRLEALEHERATEFPAPVFVRGFVRTYAQAVGLDPVDALDLLAELPSRGEQYGGGPSVLSVSGQHTIYLGKAAPQPHRGLRISHLVLVLVAVLLFVAAYVIVGSRPDDPSRSTAANDRTPAAVERPVGTSTLPGDAAPPTPD